MLEIERADAYQHSFSDDLENFINRIAYSKKINYIWDNFWVPLTDIYETKDYIMIKMDLSGVNKKKFP